MIVIVEIELHILKSRLSIPFVILVCGFESPLASDGLDQVIPAHLFPLILVLIYHVGLELIIGLILVLEYVGMLASIHRRNVRRLVRELQYLQGTYPLVVLAGVIQRVCFPKDIIHVKA
jgi:hypothetical protein